MKITKLTTHEIMTQVKDISIIEAYLTEDISIQTQLFWISDIESSASKHFLSLCNSNAYMFTQTGLDIILNAQELINIMRQGLCNKSPVIELAVNIRNAMFDIDYQLGKFCVPECVYRNGFCIHKENSCGQNTDLKNSMFSYYKDLHENFLEDRS
jgi:hypothetical protein